MLGMLRFVPVNLSPIEAGLFIPHVGDSSGLTACLAERPSPRDVRRASLARNRAVYATTPGEGPVPHFRMGEHDSGSTLTILPLK